MRNSQQPLSACAAGHVAVKPRRGTGLLFWSMPPAALTDPAQRTVDPWSEHTGCAPVGTALKYTLTIWIHYEPFRPDEYVPTFKPPMRDPAVCADHHSSCTTWAGASAARLSDSPRLLRTWR